MRIDHRGYVIFVSRRSSNNAGTGNKNRGFSSDWRCHQADRYSRRSRGKIEKGEAVHPREQRASSRAPLPSRRTLYRVNCRLFRVGRVRQHSGIIGLRSSVLFAPGRRSPPPLQRTSMYARR